MDEGYVLVVGSAGVDIRGQAERALKPETQNPGRVRNSVGGVARNIAENLARLEVPTRLISAVGRGATGRRVLKKCQASGIDCTMVRELPGEVTTTLLEMVGPEGDLLLSIADYRIMDHIDSDYLLAHEDAFRRAEMIVIDATLNEAALGTLFEIAAHYDVRVCADPTAPLLAGRLCEHLDSIYMVSPNAAETTALCGLMDPAHDRDTAVDAARHLVSLGVGIAVVTLGEQGLAYAHSSGAGYVPAINTRVIDPTGAGDAFSGAVIFGLLNDVQVDEAMRLGVTAASLTLQSRHTVLPDLSQERLYDQLAI